ncbi:hypothetical protein E2542_SST12166 [Spatholobus suberectus]|nr:hypothetical protein E2542_SST12166 [Spatholobus suberectus]
MNKCISALLVAVVFAMAMVILAEIARTIAMVKATYNMLPCMLLGGGRWLDNSQEYFAMKDTDGATTLVTAQLNPLLQLVDRKQQKRRRQCVLIHRRSRLLLLSILSSS